MRPRGSKPHGAARPSRHGAGIDAAARTGADRRGRYRRAWRRGRWSEALCRLMLRLKGYRILAAGFRAPVGEIDIVARRGGVLAIIEVKARDTLEDAAAAIVARQRRRIARAAEAFLTRNPALMPLTLRFDVMLVRPRRLPRHLPAAWRVEDATAG